MEKWTDLSQFKNNMAQLSELMKWFIRITGSIRQQMFEKLTISHQHDWTSVRTLPTFALSVVTCSGGELRWGGEPTLFEDVGDSSNNFSRSLKARRTSLQRLHLLWNSNRHINKTPIDCGWKRDPLRFRLNHPGSTASNDFTLTMSLFQVDVLLHWGRKSAWQLTLEDLMDSSILENHRVSRSHHSGYDDCRCSSLTFFPYQTTDDSQLFATLTMKRKLKSS